MTEPPARPARAEALKRVRILLNAGNVRVTHHWRKRAHERGFDNQDLLAVVKTGRIGEEGEWDEVRRNFKYRIVGYDADRNPFTVVAALSADVLFLISGMRKEMGQWQSE